jgi:uncharacterized protein (DUF2267 family)
MKDLINRTNPVESRSYRRNVISPKRRKPRSLNFEAYAGEANHFINEVAIELGTDRDRAARVTRAVLHALRDRLPPDDAIEFAQGLPMALKAVFIDQYDLSKAPVVIRSPKKFLEYIYHKDGLAAPADFEDKEAIIDGLQAVFTVLQHHMSYGQVEQIKKMLNVEIVALIEDEDFRY